MTAQEERPESFRDARGHNDQEKPSAKLGGELDLRACETWGDSAHDPGRADCPHGRKQTQSKEHQVNHVADAFPEAFQGITRV